MSESSSRSSSGMRRISPRSIAISCSNPSRSLLAARYPEEPMDRASATIPASPATTTVWPAASPPPAIACWAPTIPATSPKLAVRPSLNPYTRFRRKPPAPVLCHGSPLPPCTSPARLPAWAFDSRASVSAGGAAAPPRGSRDIARHPLTSPAPPPVRGGGREGRRPDRAAAPRHDPGAAARRGRRDLVSLLRQKPPPGRNVPVLYFGQVPVDTRPGGVEIGKRT